MKERKGKATKKEKQELKEAKKFVWIMKEFQKMEKEEQDYFIEYLEGKVEILGRCLQND